MARGTISGLVVGAVVSAVGIGTAALMMEPVALPGEDGAMVTFGQEPEVDVQAPVEVPEEAPEAVAETAPEVETQEDVARAAPEVDDPDPMTDAVPEPVAETPEAPDAEAGQEVVEDATPETTDTEAAPEVVEDTVPETGTQETAEPQAPMEEEAPEDALVTPEPAPEPSPEPAPPAEVEETAPETSMPTADDTIVTGRLPRVGGEETPDPEGAAEEDTVDAPRAPAIERNAIPYTGDPALPRMSVVLIDQGPSREDVGDLAVMPFPLSVAVDASAPDAEAAVQFYRDAGAEVVLMVPLPTGATPADVDVTFQVYEPLMDDAVAVLFPEDAGFQALGGTAVQVATVLQEEGLGLVTYPEGLNTGHKSAVKEGVPAGMVFRDLDSEGQTPDVIRRFLDNVAFRARTDEGVIAIARVRPDSLQALLEWSLGNRAQTVNLAPLSATLKDDG